MSMDRFDEVTIGHACEVEGCSIVCTPNETRCYDHSVMRLIGTLFNENEMCRFNGVTCTHQATVCNEHDVPMCESCHNVYQRIQRGRPGLAQSQGPELLPPNHRWPQRPRYVTGNQQSMGSTYEGRTIHQLAGPHDQLIREATMPPVVPLLPPEQLEDWVQRNTFENFEAQYGAPREEGEETE